MSGMTTISSLMGMSGVESSARVASWARMSCSLLSSSSRWARLCSVTFRAT